MLPPLAAAARATCPPALCAALDRAVRPDPEERGGLDDLFDALADALGEVSDEGGSIAPHPLERGLPVLPPAVGRLVAPAAAGALAWAALAGLTPDPARAAAARGRRRRCCSSPCSRGSAGWPPRSASRCCSPSAPRRGPGAAVLVARARRRRRRCCCAPTGARWALPAAAPALGLLGLAGAYPALAGRAPRWSARLALGALGAWWVVLAEPLLERALVFGAAPGTPARPRFDGAPGITAGDVIAPAASSGALLLALVWGGAARRAAVARARPLAVAPTSSPRAPGPPGVAAATVALGEWLGDRVAPARAARPRDRARWSPAPPPWRSPSCAARRRPEPGDEEP